MKNLVSAIITTHNRCDLLPKAIDAALSQTYHPMEIIVVDDASTDNTCEVCREYGDKINYVQIPKQESRGGNYARNLGIKYAKGEYVAFCDDDDEWLPTKIEKQVALAIEKQCSLVYCLRIYMDVVDGQIVRTRKEFRPKPSGDLYESIFKHYVSSTSCLLVEKALIEAVGGFDESFRKWQEYDLMIRIAQRTPIYYVDDFLCQYRNDLKDPNRISNDFDRMKETVVRIRKKYEDRIAVLPFKTRLYFYDMCVNNTYKLAKLAGHHAYQWKLFLPYIILTLFKSIDDRNIAKKNIGILKEKYKNLLTDKTK